jgi:hypothetical protein
MTSSAAVGTEFLVRCADFFLAPEKLGASVGSFHMAPWPCIDTSLAAQSQTPTAVHVCVLNGVAADPLYYLRESSSIAWSNRRRAWRIRSGREAVGSAPLKASACRLHVSFIQL